MRNSNPTRVAVIGASGIGKHHANWWKLEGAAVCAFAGAADESVAKTRSALKESFGIEAHGYTDVAAMLRAEQPDIVDICSPPRLHYEHVRAALDAGCHALCEKPFVYDPALPRETLLAQANELVTIADRTSRRLGVCTQYSAGARLFREIWRKTHGDEPIRHCHGHLESPAKGRAPEPGRVWVDLAPHPISVIQELMPDAAIQWDSVQTLFKGYEAIARFEVAASGNRVLCEIFTRNATQPPLNVRHFKINGYAFQVDGAKDAQGVYCARIVTSDGAEDHPDFLRLLIREFLAGRTIADGRVAITNLDVLTRLLDMAGENRCTSTAD